MIIQEANSLPHSAMGAGRKLKTSGRIISRIELHDRHSRPSRHVMNPLPFPTALPSHQITARVLQHHLLEGMKS